ncbi:MAG: hypothetical protein M1831_004154 [Alyxoria varia]|nr:MAG: hypothetical protein M1831_004154 [Alyxoria varia]
METETTEGEIPFPVPTANKPCKTWYKIIGTLSDPNPNYNRTPLIAIHGGPGGCHDYMLPLSDLARPPHNTPVIFYDQLGSGHSTHLREKNGDTSFWTVDLFRSELANLIDNLGLRERGFDLLGHSWGGMLAAYYASERPRGLRRLVVSNSPACLGTWVAEANRLRRDMPRTDEVLRRHEERGTTGSEEYEGAVEVFYQRHVCRVCPWPEEMRVCMRRLKEDPTTYLTMNGPSEFHVIGSLRNFDIRPLLPRIAVPTLLINGAHDEATDETVRPFFELIPGKVKWRTLGNSAHMAHLEERGVYIETVGGFLGVRS